MFDRALAEREADDSAFEELELLRRAEETLMFDRALAAKETLMFDRALAAREADYFAFALTRNARSVKKQ